MKDTEILLKEIDADIKKILSEKRYKHSVGVMKKAEELARKYGVDIEKAKVVGLAHDIAKEISKEEKLQYVKENNIEIDEIEKISIELLHGKIGADICKKKYGFSEDMQKAIQYHTTGNPEMDDLAKIILIADKTEEGRRPYIDFEKVEEYAKLGLNAELIHSLDVSIEYTIKKGTVIHPDSIYTRNNFLITTHT